MSFEEIASPPRELYLTAKDVCDRYDNNVSAKTLANWRCPGGTVCGPPYLRSGGRILYPLSELIAWEKSRMFTRNEPREPGAPATD